MFARPNCIRRQRYVKSVTHGKYYQIDVWISKDLITMLIYGLRMITQRDSLSLNAASVSAIACR
jgi:hypothetical protein